MIRFILNNQEINTDTSPGTTLLDFIRYQQYLTGTKIGCREGDCGACTVLKGELLEDGTLDYQTVVSCLTPIGNIHHKHVVTIEGLNQENLNPVQQAVCDENGTQCGFCTPGFVLSLTGFCLSHKASEPTNAIAAIDGNICRCTGYKSIERAANHVAAFMTERTKQENTIDFLQARKILPGYFSGIANRLKKLSTQSNGVLTFKEQSAAKLLGGGTDLYVQQHEEMVHAKIQFLLQNHQLKIVYEKDNRCYIGGGTTVTDLMNSPLINKIFPHFSSYTKLISSTPIRNIATIAGNIVNASPIGDFTIFLLALDAIIVLTDGSSKREIALKDFYKGYKSLDKKEEEYIESIWFEIPSNHSFFNFEKVSKRTWLDIASVNSAIKIEKDGDTILSANISAGGVGPIPILLRLTNDFLKGKSVSANLITDAIEMAQTEISPISDTRGSAAYKRFLLGQLIKAHFLTAIPGMEMNSLLDYSVD